MSKTAHALGMALLLAFAAAAFILSAARPAADTPLDRIELAELLVVLSRPVVGAEPQWSQLQADPRLRWLHSDTAPGQPVPARAAATVQRAAVQITIEGRSARHHFRTGDRTIDGWRLTAWGTPQSPARLTLTGADACTLPCMSAGIDFEQVLRSAQLEYAVDCASRVARHYRIMPEGRAPIYAVQYLNRPAREMELLLFWAPPPPELQLADGCLAVAA